MSEVPKLRKTTNKILKPKLVRMDISDDWLLLFDNYAVYLSDLLKLPKDE